MTTAALLESMTDRAKFELLATSVLRQADRFYASIIHTGVNAQGETIPSPLDGIQPVPRTSPPHFVFVQHTTEDRGKLRGKWLTRRHSDLNKAIAEAKTIRKKLLDAQFTIVFCTNQRIHANLVRDVTVKATKAKLGVDFWGQDRIAHFLDDFGHGHWLRKKFLGVEAELLSDDLLRQLCRLSLEAYRRRVLPTDGELICRESLAEVIHASHEGGISLCFLTGSSGFGKSVTAFQALEHRLNNGGFGLWLPAERMQHSASLESALNEWLLHLHPALEQTAGEAALQLASAGGHNVLVVIDDVSRTETPIKTLASVIALATPSSVDTTNAQGRAGPSSSLPCPAVIVSPIWPEWHEHIPKKTLDVSWIRTISIGALTSAEGITLIRLSLPSLSSGDATEIATRLANDPFTIGLLATLAHGVSDTRQLTSLVDDVIGKFIDTELRELTVKPGSFLLIEFKECITQLGQEMLRRRNLIPSWSEVSRWFEGAEQTLAMLRAILFQGGLARLVDGIVAFRHDRLRDRFLAEGMTGLLRDAEPPQDVIADPYFARNTGQALAQDPSLSAWIDRLFVESPLALFEAVRHFRVPRNNHQRRIVDAVSRWAATECKKALPALYWAASWILLETDSPSVKDVVDSMPPNRILSLAGLRNGSAKLGLGYFGYAPAADFEPAVNDQLRDRIVDIAIACHATQLATEIHEMIRVTDSAEIRPHVLLILLGHLQPPGFADEIRQMWGSNERLLIRHALWAATGCPDAKQAAVLDAILDKVPTIPKRSEAQFAESREWIIQELNWAFGRGMSNQAVAYFIRRGLRDEELRDDIAHLLNDVDNPDAIEFAVRTLARRGGVCLNEKSPRADNYDITIRPASSVSVARLRGLWENNLESPHIRTLAFRFWLRAGGCLDPLTLGTVSRTEPYYIDALQHRIRSGEQTSQDELIEHLDGPWGGTWWHFAHRIWSEKLLRHASTALARMKNKIPTDFSGGFTDDLFSIREMLVKIPVQDAERLLREHWAHLQYSPLMIQVALRVATTECQALATDAIRQCPSEVDVFKFGRLNWEQARSENPLTVRHLVALEPLLDRMKGSFLHLALAFEHVRDDDGTIANWIRRHLVPRLSPGERVGVQSADENFLCALDRQLKDTRIRPFCIHEIRKPTTLSDFPRRYLLLLGEWLKANATLRGLQVAATQIKQIGSRQDISLLTKHAIDGTAEEIESIVSDASFAIRRRTLN